MEHAAKQFRLGSASVIICDDQCVSEAEAEEIIKNLAERIKPYMVKTAMKDKVLYDGNSHG